MSDFWWQTIDFFLEHLRPSHLYVCPHRKSAISWSNVLRATSILQPSFQSRWNLFPPESPKFPPGRGGNGQDQEDSKDSQGFQIMLSGVPFILTRPTMENLKNRPETIRNQPGTMKTQGNSSWNHEKPTWNHEKTTWNHEKPTLNHEKPWKLTWYHEKPTWNHEKP